MSNASHQTCTEFSFLASASQQQSNQLCTTLGSEEREREQLQITSHFDGKDKKTRTSSGSISSLGSSWQSISFSKSPHTGGLTEVLENKQAVDQNCDTVPSEDGPGGSFEYLNLNSSASSIQKEHFSPSCQTGNDASKAQTGSFDHKQLFPSTELDSFEFLQVDRSEITQGNTSAANKHMNDNIKVSPPAETKDDASKFSRMSGKMIENTDSDQHCLMNCRNGCFQGCKMGSVVLTEQDYRSLLSGVCQRCLLTRLPEKPFKLRHYNKAYSRFLYLS